MIAVPLRCAGVLAARTSTWRDYQRIRTGLHVAKVILAIAAGRGSLVQFPQFDPCALKRTMVAKNPSVEIDAIRRHGEPCRKQRGNTQDETAKRK